MYSQLNAVEYLESSNDEQLIIISDYVKDLQKQNKKLQKALDIALEAIEFYSKPNQGIFDKTSKKAREAKQEIEKIINNTKP